MMSGDIISIERGLPNYAEEVICLKCLHRYICVWPCGTSLKDLECEKCGKGFIIKTGEDIE